MTTSRSRGATRQMSSLLAEKCVEKGAGGLANDGVLGDHNAACSNGRSDKRRSSDAPGGAGNRLACCLDQP